MPTKQKPAATIPEPIQPEPPQQPTPKELRQAETKHQFTMLQEFIRSLDSISSTDFEDLKTFMLIMNRNTGCATPVESFLVSLVHLYQFKENDGKGLALEVIQWQMAQDLTDDATLERTIKEAHFLASRYPLPKAEEVKA